MPERPLRDDVIENDSVEAAFGQVAIRVDVVVVTDDLEPAGAGLAHEHLVRDGSGECADPSASELAEASIPIPVARPHRQHLAKLVVGDRHGVSRAPRGRVLDAGEADREVAPLDGRVDGSEGDLDEPRLPPDPPREDARDLDVHPAHDGRVARVGLDERRAALRVAAPEEGRPGRGGNGARGRQGRGRADECYEYDAHGEEDSSAQSTITGAARPRRRNAQNVRMPKANPPMCAHHAMPSAWPPEAREAAPLKNWTRNQKPR